MNVKTVSRNSKAVQATFYLTERDKKLLANIAAYNEISSSATLRELIRQEASRLDIDENTDPDQRFTDLPIRPRTVR